MGTYENRLMFISPMVFSFNLHHEDISLSGIHIRMEAVCKHKKNLILILIKGIDKMEKLR